MDSEVSVCYIYQDQYPWEIRVDKIINSLADFGYEVHLVSRNRDGLPVEEIPFKNVFIHRLPKGMGKHLRSIINFPAFFSPFWLVYTLFIVIKFRSKLIIVRDLPLGPLALIVGRLVNIPVMMDMAENYPALIKSTWEFKGPRFIDYLIRNPFLLKRLECWIVPRLNAFLVVSQASKERIVQILKTKQIPIWVVSNTPRLEFSERRIDHPALNEIEKYPGLVILYTGMLEAHRGLDVLIRAVPLVLQKNADLLLVIVGSGRSESKLKLLAKELGVDRHVLFTGWVDQIYIPSIIASSDICIVPHYVTEHTDTTVPNKIFDYMAQKKPVIVTQSKTLSDIVHQTQCGRIYHHDSPAQLADFLIELKDEQLRERLGKSGYKAIRERFNWEEDKKVLREAVGCILKQF